MVKHSKSQYGLQCEDAGLALAFPSIWGRFPPAVPHTTCCPVPASPQPSTVPQCIRHFLETSRFIDLNNCHFSSSISCSEGGDVYYFYFLLRYFKIGGGGKKKKRRLNALMVLKQQSNSLQEGPPVIPSHMNGTGWSQGSCTHNREKDQQWQSCTVSHTGPHMAAKSHLLSQDAASLCSAQGQRQRSCGWMRAPCPALWHTLFPIAGQSCVSSSTLEDWALHCGWFCLWDRQKGQEQAARKTSQLM